MGEPIRQIEGQFDAEPPRMSYEEFLARADEHEHAEWVDGEVIVLTPASTEHGLFTAWIVGILIRFVDLHDSGLVISNAVQMKLGPQGPGREPDAMFLAAENAGRLRKTYIDGPADLAVEVVSPESQQRDRLEKFREYARGGVREYWLLDPERGDYEFYALDGIAYERIEPDAQGRLFSRVLPGLWLREEWLRTRPLIKSSQIELLWDPRA